MVVFGGYRIVVLCPPVCKIVVHSLLLDTHLSLYTLIMEKLRVLDLLLMIEVQFS